MLFPYASVRDDGLPLPLGSQKLTTISSRNSLKSLMLGWPLILFSPRSSISRAFRSTQVLARPLLTGGW